MKQTTKRLLGITAASALAVGIANAVFAQGGFGPGYGPGWGGHHGMTGGPRGMGGPYGGPGRMGTSYRAQDLAQLETALGITADQQAAWDAYVDAVRGRNDLREAHREARFSSTGVTPEELLEFRAEGLAQKQKMLDARRDLYATLTSEQQARFGAPAGPRCAAW
jgi:hypothetical protein